MDAMGTPVAGMAIGPETAIPAMVSVTTVAADLNTIVSGGHAINVHESAENIGNYVACGDIGGMMMGSDLAIGLGELNDSGVSGAAWLHDNGDGTTIGLCLSDCFQRRRHGHPDRLKVRNVQALDHS